ncbi:hypothetical protein IP88_13135 [alpha proteobacterium AAP81b]|nr:hypothetical protein IP88_13135 [alpha proteobacterium AAP81b]
MSFAEKLFDGLRATMVLRGDVDRMATRLEKVADDMLDHEKRLIRLETLVEVARAAPRLPG